jgi:uncharacterized membrane protein
MAYNASYNTADFSAMVVDLLGTALFQVVQFVALIVLIAIVFYLFGRLKQAGLMVK